jgi:hypothetical protein
MWTEALENPKALEMFNPEPLLKGVTLGKLLLDRDGPTATITIQIKEYPTNPPVKWRVRQYNAVTIELQAMAIEDIRILGWTTENQVSISIKRLPEGGLWFQAVGSSEVELHCGWLRVIGVTPYCLAT